MTKKITMRSFAGSIDTPRGHNHRWLLREEDPSREGAGPVKVYAVMRVTHHGKASIAGQVEYTYTATVFREREYVSAHGSPVRERQMSLSQDSVDGAHALIDSLPAKRMSAAVESDFGADALLKLIELGERDTLVAQIFDPAL